MELYIGVVGGQEWVRMLQADIGAQWLEIDASPALRKQMIDQGMLKEGDPCKHRIKIQVREMKILSLVYPEEHHNTVMSMLAPYDTTNKYVNMMRKIFRPFARMLKIRTFSDKELKSIKRSSPIIIHNPFVRVVPLGCKKDGRGHDGQEML